MKLMLIDDEVSILRTMKKILGREQHECLIFENPQEAVLAYPIVRPDAVITDIKMPGMSGIEVLKEIRKIDRRASVIILTGHADVESAIAAVNNGACAFFRKPPAIEELLGVLESIAGRDCASGTSADDGDELGRKYELLKDELAKVKDAIEKLAVIHGTV